MSTPAGIMTTQTPKSDQVHLVTGAQERGLDNTESSAIPAVTENLRNNDPGMVPSLLREVAEFKSHTTSILAPTQIYSGEVHRGGGVISQTHVDQDLALQQDGLAPTSGAFDASCREINPESMQCHSQTPVSFAARDGAGKASGCCVYVDILLQYLMWPKEKLNGATLALLYGAGVNVSHVLSCLR
ncbi:hypothetical protein EDB87DRAFT_1582374 [Lactarius vividus]|nr:hypothetical protein EDB87DRAFT_1582374 [Lactarius vividus]